MTDIASNGFTVLVNCQPYSVEATTTGLNIIEQTGDSGPLSHDDLNSQLPELLDAIDRVREFYAKKSAA